MILRRLPAERPTVGYANKRTHTHTHSHTVTDLRNFAFSPPVGTPPLISLHFAFLTLSLSLSFPLWPRGGGRSKRCVATLSFSVPSGSRLLSALALFILPRGRLGRECQGCQSVLLQKRRRRQPFFFSFFESWVLSEGRCTFCSFPFFPERLCETSLVRLVYKQKIETNIKKRD